MRVAVGGLMYGGDAVVRGVTALANFEGPSVTPGSRASVWKAIIARCWRHWLGMLCSAADRDLSASSFGLVGHRLALPET